MALARAKRSVKKLGPPPHFKHQLYTRKVLKENERVMDASDAGTGKTRPHIEDFAERRRAGGGCALVFAPKSSLHTVWELDAAQFASDMKVSLAYASNRKDAFAKGADMYVTNTDAVTWIAKQPASFFKGFDTLIIDEVSAYKHHTSQRSRAMAKIKKYFPHYRRALSGSLNSNGICDTWHPMLLVDDGRRLGSSFFAFRGAVCQPVQVGPKVQHVRWEDKPNAEAAVGFLIKDITIKHVFEECVDIPPNRQYARTFVMSGKHRAAYEKMKRDSILLLERNEITAVNAAVLRGKLLQIASGAVYDNAGKYQLLDKDRYELVTDLVDEVQHSVIFFQWQHQRDEIARQLRARKISFALIDGSVTKKGARDDAIKHYQSGFFRTMLLHPQSAAHAITLTKGTRTIWASPTDNAEWWVQAFKRIYRIGQKQKTETIGVVAEDSLDEVVWERRGVKEEKMKNLVNYLKGTT